MDEQYVKDILLAERHKMKRIKALENIIESLEKRKDLFTLEWISNIEVQIHQLSIASYKFWEIIKSHKIDDLERSVLVSYYFDGKTYRKVARANGYNSHVSIIKIIDGAIKKITSNQSEH
jgi:DNA-directed RNA polymerase specialized sigma subunit